MSDRHHPEELISASLTGELGFDERAELDAHLASCEHCRGVRAEFLDQRRLLGGMRREPAPRSLGPLVQAAIASGATGSLPWWRQPRGMAALGGAAVAVLLLGVTAGLAIQGGGPDRTLVGGPATPTFTVTAFASPTPDSTPSAAPLPTATLASTPAPTAPPPPPAATLTPTPAPPAPATESPAPPADSPLDPGSVAFLQVTDEPEDESFTVREPELDEDGYPADLGAAAIIARPSEWSGPVMSAELSPDGEWLAYQTARGLSGITDVWAVHLAEGELISLGETLSDTPFTQRMAWSQNGHRLAYTLVESVEPTPDVDAWVFDSETRELWQVTNIGNAYAANFQTADQLWISVADERPVSYRLTLAGAGHGATLEETDLQDRTSLTVDGAFQPLFSPDGRHAIFWRGRMAYPEGGTWRLAEGGMPYLASLPAESGDHDPSPDWQAAVRLFPDLVADRDAFAFASITWSFNSDDYAVWNAVWTGTPMPTDQADSGEFPDATLIYFGKVSADQLITDYPYVDLVSERQRGSVVRDVEFAPGAAGTIDAIWTTVQLPIGGDRETPMAVLEVTPAGPSGYEPAPARRGVWRGPAVYFGEPPDVEGP